MKRGIEFVRETIDLVKSIETRFLELGARLYKIKEEKLWEGTYDSYYEFLDAAHVNPSMATMLTKVHQFYVVEGKKQPEQLKSIGYSTLYAGIPLIEKHGIEKTVVMASTLTRQEIIEESRDMVKCDHKEVITICSKCKKRIS